MPNVKIDFYRMELPDDYDGDFETLLRTVAALPANQRNLRVQGGWVHFEELVEGDRRFRGTIVRVRADQLPQIADLTGILGDIALAADQGLAVVTHFYYRRANRVLLLLGVAQGVRGPTFEYFFGQKANVMVALQPVPQLEIVQRLRRMQEVKKVEFQLSNPDALHHFRAGRGIASLIEIMDDFNAPTVELTLTIGRRRSARLNRQRAVTLGEQLLRLSNETGAVDKARLVGFDPDDARNVALDLLHGKMVESADIPIENRRLSDAACIAALENAYVRRRADLDEMYPSGAE